MNEQKKESDINCKTKRTDEGHLEKLEPLEMEKLTKTEDGRESRIEEMSSINEIQSLTTDDILKEYSNLSNSKITFPAKSESRPSSIDKSNLTSTQETLDRSSFKTGATSPSGIQGGGGGTPAGGGGTAPPFAHTSPVV